MHTLYKLDAQGQHVEPICQSIYTAFLILDLDIGTLLHIIIVIIFTKYHEYISITCEVIIFTKYHEDTTIWPGQDINNKILTFDLYV